MPLATHSLDLYTQLNSVNCACLQFEKIKLQATAAAETLASVKHQRPATIGKATAVKANAVAEQNGAAPATPESAVSESANVPQTDADMAAEDRTST